MKLSNHDWLRKVVAHRPAAPRGGPEQPLRRVDVRRARALLGARLEDLGLLYGTPLLPADVAPEEGQREKLILALTAGLVELGHALADALHRPAARRDADLAAVFLAFAGLPEEGAALAGNPRPSQAAVSRAFARAAPRLAERMEQLTADPVYGVPLHNGLTWVDAWSFGRIALGFFARGELDASIARRRLQSAGRDKATLVEALVQLVWSGGAPSASVKRAMARQIGSLGLPRATGRGLREALERPGRPSALAAKVHGREHRRFVLAQAILASLVDGRRSRAERAFLTELAGALGFGDDDVTRLELRLTRFYAEHRAFVDTFSVPDAGAELADELVDDLSRTVQKNLEAMTQELKQTGELAELLAKAARGTTLTDAERLRLRQDLVDVAKAVPSLAILAAPGGLFLLAALTRVLPFSILPSAWGPRPPK